MLDSNSQLEMGLSEETSIPVVKVNQDNDNQRLLVAEEISSAFSKKILKYAELYFVTRPHILSMNSLLGDTRFEMTVSQAPEQIFNVMMKREVSRLSDAYKGKTGLTLRFNDLVCTFSKVSKVDWPKSKECWDKKDTIKAFNIALAGMRWDLVVKEINTKAKNLEAEGKKIIANRLMGNFRIKCYGNPAANNLKATKKHFIASNTVSRWHYDNSLESATRDTLRNLHKDLRLVAVDTNDTTLVPALDEMNVGATRDYSNEIGVTFGNKAKNYIRMHKETMKLALTHDSFEQLLVWIMSHTDQEIAELPPIP